MLRSSICCTALLLSASAASASSPEISDLLDMNLEQLLSMEVYSVAKKPQPLTDSAAAVFILSNEEIRRSGARNVPELLRMVPGVQVAQINAYAYAISVRGFNSAFSNKLLVMVDGRTLYAPDFSGVYWDSVDPPLYDIERIEVIRGPGGALWGANAVNGVINIITKSAAATQGGALIAGAGDEERGFAGLRYGGELENGTSYRVFAQGRRVDETPPQWPELLPVTDQWRNHHFGFRIDGRANDRCEWMVQGGTQRANLGEDNWDLFVAEVEQTNHYLLGHWRQTTDDLGYWGLQVYYDYKKRSDPSLMDMLNKTLDLEFQRFLERGPHQLLWGLGYRHLSMETPYTTYYQFDPRKFSDSLLNLFAQDEIALSDKLRLTLGAKLEHHYYTEWELQPTARLLWRPDSQNSWWGAISRAVRAPSRYEHDSYLERPAYPEEELLYAPYEFRALRQPNKNMKSETVVALELGHRQRFDASRSIDVALFHNEYRDLSIVKQQLLFDEIAGYAYVTQMSNEMEGNSQGVEITANWLIDFDWRLSLAYTWTHLDMRSPANLPTDYDISIETRTPRHQWTLNSHHNLGNDWELDLQLRHASELPQLVTQEAWEDYHAEGYTTLDLRLAWKPRSDLELSLIGRNLLDDARSEFADEPITLYFRNQVERSLYAQLRWDF